MFNTGQIVVNPAGFQFVVTRPGSIVTGVVSHPEESIGANPMREVFYPTARLVAS